MYDSVIINGDCLKVMKSIPDNSVDLVLADPPFGTTQNKWDVILNLDSMWEAVWRVLKPSGAVVLCASQPFTSILIASQIKHFKTEWVWVKNKGSGHLNAKKMPMKFHETLEVFYKRAPTYNPQKTTGHKDKGHYIGNQKTSSNYGPSKATIYAGGPERHPRNVLEIPVINNDGTGVDGHRVHPTQKPIALMKYMINTYSDENDVVLEFTMGSGSTGVAARNLNRRFIGIELDSTYYSAAKERIGESAKCIVRK